ncbi:hypothetical protein Tco_1578398 [Tanacetum coccineum]
MDEANCSFRTIEVERLTTYEFFVVSRFCYKSSSRTGVSVGITIPAIAAACTSRAVVTLSATIRWSFLADLEFIDGIQKTFLIFLMMNLDIIDDYGREKVHLDDSRIPQFAPRNVPDLSYESFLLSQSLEGSSGKSERVGEAIETTPNEFEELEYVFPGEAVT